MASTKKAPVKLMTEQAFIEKFKKEGFALYKTEGIEEKQKNHECLEKHYNELSISHSNLKNSFNMVKTNFEREKNRLDRVIETAFNISKPVINSIPVSELTAKNECNKYQA